MERKEAEVQALWARLDRTGSRGSSRRGGGDDHDGGEVAAAATSHAREVNSRKCVQTPLSLASFLAVAGLQLAWNRFPIIRCPAFSCISCRNFCSDDSSNQNI
jgi:hypothetical protein